VLGNGQAELAGWGSDGGVALAAAGTSLGMSLGTRAFARPGPSATATAQAHNAASH
jgi:hypothetical protein